MRDARLSLRFARHASVEIGASYVSFLWSFELLAVINVGIVLLAALRQRPATCILALDQVLVLRSLIAIQNLGRPESQVSVPLWVFSPNNVPTAIGIFAVAAAVQLFFVLLPSKRVECPGSSLQPVPRPVLVVLLAYFAVAALSSDTIFAAPYLHPRGWTIQGIELGGLNQLFLALFFYEIVRRIFSGQLRPWKGLAVIGLVFLFTDYLKGSTGNATGFLVTAALILPMPSGATTAMRWRHAAKTLGIILAIASFTFLVRQVRTTLYNRGADAVSDVVDIGVHTYGAPATGASGYEDAGIGYQYAAHIYECISLYDMGRSREWKSFYQVIEFTLKPSFLGFDRSEDAAYDLQDHFVGGGGSYTVGEFYWNGGYLAVVVGFILVAGWAFLCDTRYRRGQMWLALFCTFAPQLLEGAGYGLVNLARGAANGIWLALLLWGFRFISARRQLAGTPGRESSGREPSPTMAQSR